MKFLTSLLSDRKSLRSRGGNWLRMLSLSSAVSKTVCCKLIVGVVLVGPVWRRPKYMSAPAGADQEVVCCVSSAVASCREWWYEGKEARSEFGGLFIAMPLDGRSACHNQGRNARGISRLDMGGLRAAKSLQSF